MVVVMVVVVMVVVVGKRVLADFEERLGVCVFEGVEVRATRNGVLMEEEKFKEGGERSGDRLRHFIAFHQLQISALVSHYIQIF